MENQYDRIATITVFFAADILLYFIVLGHEGDAGWWCAYCDLMKTDWQAQGHRRGQEWTMEKLIAQATTVLETRQRLTPRETQGVRSMPVLTSVPVSHYIVSLLHITIGKGNDILNHLVDEMQASGVVFTAEYMVALENIYKYTDLMSESADKLSRFNAFSSDEISRLELEERTQMRANGTLLSPDEYQTVQQELSEILEHLSLKISLSLRISITPPF